MTRQQLLLLGASGAATASKLIFNFGRNLRWFNNYDYYKWWFENKPLKRNLIRPQKSGLFLIFYWTEKPLKPLVIKDVLAFAKNLYIIKEGTSPEVKVKVPSSPSLRPIQVLPKVNTISKVNPLTAQVLKATEVQEQARKRIAPKLSRYLVPQEQVKVVSVVPPVTPVVAPVAPTPPVSPPLVKDPSLWQEIASLKKANFDLQNKIILMEKAALQARIDSLERENALLRERKVIVEAPVPITPPTIVPQEAISTPPKIEALKKAYLKARARFDLEIEIKKALILKEEGKYRELNTFVLESTKMLEDFETKVTIKAINYILTNIKKIARREFETDLVINKINLINKDIKLIEKWMGEESYKSMAILGLKLDLEQIGIYWREDPEKLETRFFIVCSPSKEFIFTERKDLVAYPYPYSYKIIKYIQRGKEGLEFYKTPLIDKSKVPGVLVEKISYGTTDLLEMDKVDDSKVVLIKAEPSEEVGGDDYPLLSYLNKTSWQSLIPEIESIKWPECNSYGFFDSIMAKLRFFKKALEEINIKKGYVETSNILDKNEYPLISSLGSLLLKQSDYNKMTSFEKIRCWKWISNLIKLNLLLLSTRLGLKLKKTIALEKEKASMGLLGIFINPEWQVLKSFIKIYSSWALNSLDNSLKQHLIKNKIRFIEDIVVGFDTEYVQKEWKSNELLSAQLSITRVTKIIVPIKKAYNFETLNTITNESYVAKEPPFKELKTVKFYIDKIIELIRYFRFGTFDAQMRIVTRHLLSKKSRFDIINKDSDNIYFQMKKEPIRRIFIKGLENEKLELNTKSLLSIILGNNKSSYQECVSLISEGRGSEGRGSELLIEDFVGKRNDSWDGTNFKQSPLEELLLSNALNKALNIDETKKNIPKSLELIKKNLGLGRTTLEAIVNRWEEIIEGQSSENFSSPLYNITSLKAGKKENNNNNNSFCLENSFKEQHLAFKELAYFSRKLYLCAHYNAADLTMLKDWDSISEKNIDLLKKSYVSIVSPLMSFANIPVHIRDTLLLASAAAASLDKVGKGHKMSKIPLEERYKKDMRILWSENPVLFKEYGMFDSLITLIHALFTSDFALCLGDIKVPMTLGALSAKYLKNKWKIDGYKGHQPNSEFLLGNAQASHTPKGINSIGFAAENENLYIASFRGGRNECFKYGIDKDTVWYDYDLASCYATIMSNNGDPFYQEFEDAEFDSSSNILTLAGSPHYEKACILHPNSKLDKYDFLHSYSAIKVRFNLPESIKYPPLPVFMDKTITIYPLSGESVVTGTEFLSARFILDKALLRISAETKVELSDLNKKYYIKIVTGSYIPFKRDDSGNLAYKPFLSAIQELQQNRAKFRASHGKGSALERTYKDLGNMIYGKTVCGISNKRNYDPRTSKMKSMIGGPLSNPIIGAWITGLVRALIAELLNAVDTLGGKVTACTTDGFVCDIPDLENKLLEFFQKDNFYEDSLLKIYRDSRELLTNGKDPRALEVKTSTIGIIQWSTRGQLSYNHEDPSLENGPYPQSISAMTGFQKFHYDHNTIRERVVNAMSIDNKIFFLQKRLTGARDFAQVSYISALRIFRTVFDSKRAIMTRSDTTMLDTLPWVDASQALLTRSLMRLNNNSIYSEKYSRAVIYSTSSDSREELLKYFVRLVLGYFEWKPSCLDILSIVDLVSEFGKGTKFKNREYAHDFVSATLENPGKVMIPSGQGTALSHTIESAELRENLIENLNLRLKVFRERIVKEL
jgi:hypothetical protein